MRKIRFSRLFLEDILIIGLLFFAPLALASVHTWAYTTIALTSLLLFNLRFLKSDNSLERIIETPIVIGFSLFVLASMFYLVPIPVNILKVLSSNTFGIREAYTLDHPSWQPLSLYIHGTMIYIIKSITYAMIFVVVLSKIITSGKETHQEIPPQFLRDRYYSFVLLGALAGVLSILFHSLCDFNLHIPANALYFTVMIAVICGTTWKERSNINYRFLFKLVNSIIIISFFIAVFGIIQKFSWNGKIYWTIEKPGSHFGPYINYDHYAGYMEMCIFLAMANFLIRITNSSLAHIKKLKDKIIWFSSAEANKTLIYLFMIIVMATSLFLTTSRGGIMSFVMAFIVFYAVSILSISRHKRNRLLVATLALLLLAFVMILWVGPEETVDRFMIVKTLVRSLIGEKAVLSEIRPHMWKDTINLIKDFPVFGTGLGTYFTIYLKYRTFPAHYGLLIYAHNDYLQLVAEMGVIGLAFIMAFLLWYFNRFRDYFHIARNIRK